MSTYVHVNDPRCRVSDLFREALEVFEYRSSELAHEYAAASRELPSLVTSDDHFTGYDALELVKGALDRFRDSLAEDGRPFKLRQIDRLLEEIRAAEKVYYAEDDENAVTAVNPR